MSLKKKKILGVGITTDSKQIILEYINKYLDEPAKKVKKSLVIVTPNPEQIVLAQQDPHFAKQLNQADVAIPDGIGVAWTANIGRIQGVEFMEELVEMAAKRGDRIGLIGGYGGLAVRALECLQAKYPGLKGWALEPEELSIGKIAEKIQKTNVRIVFVGLGAPKQEYFIEILVNSLQLTGNSSFILMSVGGSFDFISGRLKRAPLFIRSIGFEWLWRLAIEPWRWKRQLALWKFGWLVLKETAF